MIQVPKQDLERFETLIRVQRAALAKLVESILASTPQRSLSAFVHSLPDSDGLAANERREVTRLFFQLSTVWQRGFSSPTELLDGVAQFLERQLPTWDPNNWSDRAGLVVTAISADTPLFVMARAAILAADYGSLLNSSRTLSDVRFVFNAEAADVLGAVVAHMLVLTITDQDGRIKDVHIRLDENDIVQLVDHLNRARAKAAVIRGTLEGARIADLTPEDRA